MIIILDHDSGSGDVARLLPDVGGADVVQTALALLAATVLVALFEEERLRTRHASPLLHLALALVLRRSRPLVLQTPAVPQLALEAIGAVFAKPKRRSSVTIR